MDATADDVLHEPLEPLNVERIGAFEWRDERRHDPVQPRLLQPRGMPCAGHLRAMCPSYHGHASSFAASVAERRRYSRGDVPTICLNRREK